MTSLPLGGSVLGKARDMGDARSCAGGIGPMVDDNTRLPLTRSLETEVLAAFAVPAHQTGLDTEALLAALKHIDCQNDGLSAALSSAGFQAPDSQLQAICNWIDAIFKHWAHHFPVAPELLRELNRARPLVAAFAITEPRFFTPGAHGVHRLMDAVHDGFVGWHSGLGDSAQKALEGIRKALDRARGDFPSEPQVDETLELLRQRIDKHDRQLERLDPMLLEREAASIGDDIARLSAAAAINALLADHKVPGSVARFMKSDWFESGVIIARRFGLSSPEFQQFRATSEQLVQAVQPAFDGDTSEEQLANTLQTLPVTLARQLLNLQPDNDAVAGAIGLIEYALLRNMRGEDLGLLDAAPIEVHGLPDAGPPSTSQLTDEGIALGQWYAVDTPEGEIRVRLVGGLADNIYLVFMDFQGARALRKTFVEFRTMLRSAEARPLPLSDTFCRSMVEATEAQEHARKAEAARAAELEAARQAREREEQAQLSERLAGRNPSYSPDRHTAEPAGHDHQSLSAGRADELPTGEQPYERRTVVQLAIPMGTWLGFHDREPPMLAKVAVRDLEKDSYIFTNREGIKLRELTVAQLIALIDRDMVDILERKGSFRDTINQMRHERERLAPV